MADSLDDLNELDVAITHHLHWVRGVHRAVLLGERCNPGDVASDAEHRCRFGRWYETQASESVRRLALFAELGERHRELHDAARVLLVRRSGGEPLHEGLLAGFLDRVLDLNCLAQRLHNELLTALAVRDPLTGVFNRHLMQRQLEAEWSRFERFGQPCALALVDIDHFKDVNDRYGHQTGDAVLRELATTLGRQLRAYDNFCFRFGGEEFLVCLPGISRDALPSALERLRRAAEDMRLATEHGDGVRVTTSIGAAFFERFSTLRATLNFADRALYDAKQAGRNRVCVHGL
jgi:diguanylate cyclase (GGDEF)-like protein